MRRVIGGPTEEACRRSGPGAVELPRVLTVLGLLAAQLFASSGCSGHAPYPKAWPPLRPAPRESCERVAGSYGNQGERGQMEQYGPVYLSEMLFNVPGTAATETVRLSFPERDQLEVVITGTEPNPRSLYLSRKTRQFKCDDSTLIIYVSPAEWVHGMAPSGAPVVAGESVVMKVDLVAGCLIVTRRDKDFMWLPFPGWSTWSSWYRFCAVSSDAIPQSAR